MKLVAAGIGSDQLGVRGSYRAKLRRREVWWAWLSLLTLVACWDAAARLDEKVMSKVTLSRGLSLPRDCPHSYSCDR
jgi:hypothetical protein